MLFPKSESKPKSSDGEYSIKSVREVRAVGDFLIKLTTTSSFYNTTLLKLYSYGL